MAVGHPALLRVTRGDERAAAALFYATCQTMALTLFPTLGGTAPPWRWRRAILASSLVQHAIYVGVVAALDRP